MARSEVGRGSGGRGGGSGGRRDRGGLSALAGSPVGLECLPGLKSTTANLRTGQFNVFARLEVPQQSTPCSYNTCGIDLFKFMSLYRITVSITCTVRLWKTGVRVERPQDHTSHRTRHTSAPRGPCSHIGNCSNPRYTMERTRGSLSRSNLQDARPKGSVLASAHCSGIVTPHVYPLPLPKRYRRPKFCP